ncbi:MAG TPA: S8 family serine peptidase [Blastocatellia bacterium]|nr:S8 family serine peptidase [Blastocatellia bacterium]
MKRASVSLFILIFALVFQVRLFQVKGATGLTPSFVAHVDPLLSHVFSARAPGATATVAITYDHKPGSADLLKLQSIGIANGYKLSQLPMVIANLNAAQLASVRNFSGVQSIWANRVMKLFTNASRPFIGVNATTADTEVTKNNKQNPGFPISGKGVGIGYVDTGVDATNKDLPLGTKVAQNVIQPLAEGTISGGELGVGEGVDISDTVVSAAGFAPPDYVENVPFSDVESGHGTFGAGVAAGLGVNSGGFYGGVATGSQLVVVNSGTDSGLPLVAILGAYDYLLVNQFQYNIRVINNSWGSSLADSEIDPLNPINVATRIAHDRNIVVVFAAGNAGTADDAINPYSTMAWTISVAAGEKQGLGTPADFSSRGKDNGPNPDVAGMPANPNAPPNLRPDIIGSGVDIKSVRSHGPGITNVAGTVPVFVGSNDLTTIAPGFLPYYTTSQGTSFSCPQVSGVAALMLEANPLLTPDDIVTILRQTATPMPYEEKVVGAGYVDAHNAVRAAMGLSAVAHPANLFPSGTGPQIVDVAGDQFGTGAQDILSAQYAYDAANRQIVYTMTLADLSTVTSNMAWIQESDFKSPTDPNAPTTTIYVSASIGIDGTPTYDFGDIVVSNNVRNQTSLGAVDSGVIQGNQIIIRISVDKINAAVGYDIVGTTSTGTQAIAQLLVGAQGTGLLLAADTATGANFQVTP